MENFIFKTSLRYVTLFLLISVFATPVCCSREIIVAFTDDIPPFVMNNASEGLEVDILREALKYKDHTFRVMQCSYKRLAVAVAEMGIDAAAAVRTTDDGTYYSDSFIAFENYAITKKQSGITLQSIGDLKGHTIFTWQNAYRDLGPEFEALFSPSVKEPHIRKYHEIGIQKGQVQMFWRDPESVIIIDKSIFIWFTKQFQPDALAGDQIVYNEIFPIPTQFQVNFKSKAMRDDFNQGLKYIRDSGIYQGVFDTYLK